MNVHNGPCFEDQSSSLTLKDNEISSGTLFRIKLYIHIIKIIDFLLSLRTQFQPAKKYFQWRRGPVLFLQVYFQILLHFALAVVSPWSRFHTLSWSRFHALSWSRFHTLSWSRFHTLSLSRAPFSLCQGYIFLVFTMGKKKGKREDGEDKKGKNEIN